MKESHTEPIGKKSTSIEEEATEEIERMGSGAKNLAFVQNQWKPSQLSKFIILITTIIGTQRQLL